MASKTYKIIVMDFLGAGLPGAKVALVNADRTVSASGQTDINGRIEIPTDTEPKYISASYPGLNSQEVEAKTETTVFVMGSQSATVEACAGTYRKRNDAGKCVFDWWKFLKKWWWAFLLAIILLVSITVYVTRKLKK